MTNLAWKAPTYEGDRHLAMCGQISVGAVFPPCGGKYWRWRSWIGTTTNPAEGSEKTAAAAKAAVAGRFNQFLELAGLTEKLEPSTSQIFGGAE